MGSVAFVAAQVLVGCLKYVEGGMAVGGILVPVGGVPGDGWVMRQVVGAAAWHVHERDAAPRRRPGGGEQRA